jgi:hypothetical protein
MSMLDQREKRETFRNDLSLRNKSAQSEGSTYKTHAEADANQARAGGRYSAELAQTVVGSEPFPKYPALPSGPWSGEDLVGQEPPLGYSVDGSRPEQFAVIPAQSATGGAPAKPSAVAAPPSSHESPTPRRNTAAPLSSHFGGVGGGLSPPIHRRL